jgi:hypothetical protein
MKKIVQTKHYINAPIDRLWANISKGSGVNTWFPIITSCHLQGQGEGAKRVCISEQGELLETIVKIDHTNKVFKYSIDKQSFFPVENIIGTMTLKENENNVQLDWDLEFNIEDEAHFPVIKESIEGLFAVGATGLENTSK